MNICKMNKISFDSMSNIKAGELGTTPCDIAMTVGGGLFSLVMGAAFGYVGIGVATIFDFLSTHYCDHMAPDQEPIM